MAPAAGGCGAGTPGTMDLPPRSPVKLVYLARLREAFDSTGEPVDLPADVATVAQLRTWLAARGGRWAEELAPGRAVRFAVNHAMATATTTVAAGDEVALFPPVTGG